MVKNIGEVMGAGSWSRTGRACEVDGSSERSLVIKGLEEWLIPWGLCSPSEGPGQVGEMGREDPLEIPQRQMQVLHLGRNSRGWGDLWESALWRRAGVLSVNEYMGWNFRNQVSCWRLKALEGYRDTRTVAAIKANREQFFLVWRMNVKSQRQDRK